MLPDINPCISDQLNYDKSDKTIRGGGMEMTVSSRNDSEKTGQLQKNKTELSYTIQSQNDWRLKHKTLKS